MNNIGLNIKYLRKQQGLTQDELARKINIKRSIIGSYEEQRAVPKIDLLQQLAYYFKLSIDELVNEQLWETANYNRTQQDYEQERKLQILTTVVNDQNEERITLVPEKAKAGYTSGYSDPDYVEKLPTFDLPLPELSRNRTYRVFQISGESMLPVLPGSYMIGEYIIDLKDINIGKTYILVTKNDGIVYKRILPDNENNHNLMLKSDNPKFTPYSIPKNDILELWKVVGYISTEMPDPKDIMLNKIRHLYTELQAELAKLQENTNK